MATDVGTGDSNTELQRLRSTVATLEELLTEQERTVAEQSERLVENEQRFRLAVDASPNGLLMVNAEGTILLVNDRVEELFGYAAGELDGQCVDVLLPERLREQHPAQRAAFFAAPERRAMGGGRYLPARRKDGTEFPVEVGLNPIRIPEEQAALVSIVDVTVRKRLDDALTAKQAAAEAANRAKSEFLANMSHELRTPLNSIIGFSNVLLKNKHGHLGSGDLRYLTRVRDNGLHLLGLINEILDLSRIEVGQLELHLASVDPVHLVRATVEELQGDAAERGLFLRYEESASRDPIDADPQRLKQVVINLVGNAVKFTREGGVTVRVPAWPGTRRAAAIEVVDTGIGIPEDAQARVFEAFQQVDATTSREFGGTGLGLAISHELCERMGFSLEVESAVGRGSTFRIRLP